MEFFILAIILIGLVLLSLRFGYDSRALAYSKELEQARLGMVWEIEAGLHQAELRGQAELWRGHHHASTGSRRATGRVRRRVALGLRVLARRLSPELVTPHMMDLSQQQVAGC